MSDVRCETVPRTLKCDFPMCSPRLLFAVLKLKVPAAFAAIAIWFALSLITVRLPAQSTFGTVTGTVSDPQSRVVPGALVTATEVQRGIAFKATTNSAGLYRLSMPIGNYTLQVQMPGFGKVTQPTFALEVGQTDQFNFQLKVGAVDEVVQVTASDSPLLQRDSAQLATVIDEKTVDGLPLATGNYVQLTLLVPGATHPDPTSMTSVQSQQTSGRPFINGNNEQSNNFLLDGLENNQLSDNLIGYSPSVDAIQEFTVITQNPPAEYGNFEGGTITTSVKSGTNKFHGRLFEFVRNNIFNASPWSEGNTPGVTKTALRWNMFGGTLGGPILHNKLFFFVDYQGQRYDIPSQSQSATILTAKMQAGDFSEILPGSTVFGDNPGIALGDPSTNINPATGARPALLNNNLANIANPTAAFPGIDPAAKALFATGLYPTPTITTRLLNNYTYTTRSSTNVNQGDLKLDYAISDRDHLFARVSKSYTGSPTLNSWALMAASNNRDWADSGIAGWTHTISPSIVNDVRFGVNYTKNDAASTLGNLGDLASKIGIGYGNSNYGHDVPGFPHINLGTYFTAIGDADVISLFADTSLQADDELTITHGRHTIRTGFQFRRYRINTFFSTTNGAEGALGYTGAWTGTTAGLSGLGGADFLYGALGTEDRGADNGTWGQRATILAAYVQDDWKITRTLTLNLGLRYDNHLPWYEVNDKEVNFDLQTGAPIYPKGEKQATALNAVYGAYSPEVSPNRATYNAYNLGWNFQPRVGFAWSPHVLGDRLVVRGAGAATSYMEGTGTNLRITENPPFVYSYSLGFAGDNTISPNQTQSPTGQYYNTEYGFSSSVSPSLLGSGLRVWDPNIKPAVDIMWNLSLQYQLTKNDTVQLSYVGQKVTRLMVPMNYAQFNEDGAGNVIPGPFLGEQQTFNTKSGLFQVPGPYSAGMQEAVAFGAAAVGNQGYNSLQAVYQHRFARNLEAQLSYTFSKCMADNVGYYGNAHGQSQPQGFYRQNQYDRKAEWGPCYYNTPQIFTGYAVYTLPFGHGQALGNHWNSVANTALSNWQIGVINTDHEGYSLTAIDWRVYPVTWGNFVDVTPRASCAGPVHYTRHFDASVGGMRFWDTTNFVTTPAGGYGSCRNGTIRGPGESEFDLSLQKMFDIGKIFHLQFRAEAVNVLNHPLFQMPDTALSDGPIFGVASGATAAENERQIQFGLKLFY
jgi:hypothetical protein